MINEAEVIRKADELGVKHAEHVVRNLVDDGINEVSPEDYILFAPLAGNDVNAEDILLACGPYRDGDCRLCIEHDILTTFEDAYLDELDQLMNRYGITTKEA